MENICKTWEPCLSANNGIYNSMLEAIDNYIPMQITKIGKARTSGPMSGLSGQLLYCFYSALHRENEAMYELAIKKLEQLLATVNPLEYASFCSGTAGVIWLLGHLDKTGIVPGAASAIEDDLLERLCSESLLQIGSGEYDFMHAGLGIAWSILCSETLTYRFATYLSAVVAALDESKMETDAGIFWYYPVGEKQYSEKVVSFGLSHGLASILTILSAIADKGIAKEKAQILIDGCRKFILSKKYVSSSLNLYPSVINPESIKRDSSRLGWCYGDLNIAIALHRTLSVIPDYSIEKEIQSIIAQTVANQQLYNQSITDGSICHGTCGIAHIYNRLYNLFGTPELKGAAVFWFDQTLPKVSASNGQVTVLNTRDYKLRWTNDMSVLTGVAGVGLTFLSAIAPVSPAWDEMFLLSF